MGYSFATPCKSKKARDEMMAFLNDYYRSWDQVIKPFKEELFVTGSGNMRVAPQISFDTRLRGPVTEAAYDDGKTRIAFDYGAGFSDAERYWMYNLCYWMAQRVGRRRTFSKKAPGCGAVPYVVYDGFEAWPVLEKSEFGDKVAEDNEWLVEQGFRGMESLVEWEHQAAQENAKKSGEEMPKAFTEWLASRAETARIVDKAIKAELLRLSGLWDARNNSDPEPSEGEIHVKGASSTNLGSM